MTFSSPGARGEADDPQRFGTVAFYAAIGRAFVTFCLVVPVLYAIELLDWILPVSLDRAGGIQPWNPSGIDGVIFAPLLHANFSHVASNSVPLILLGTFVLAGQPRRFLFVTGTVMLIAGLGTWFVGAPGTVHVGASGVIFGYFGYLLLSGFLDRRLWRLGVAALVALLYGWMLLGVLPSEPHISWQGHLFGFIGGIVAAVVFRNRRPKGQPLNKPPTTPSVPPFPPSPPSSGPSPSRP